MPITINAKTSKKSFKIDSIVPGDICDADTIKMTALKIKTKKEINKATRPKKSVLKTYKTSHF